MVRSGDMVKREGKRTRTVGNLVQVLFYTVGPLSHVV